MPSQTITVQKIIEADSISDEQLTAKSYSNAEQEFIQLLGMEDLDKRVASEPSIVISFENALTSAIFKAYEQEPECVAAHRFLQRILYRINRLNLFWYDDLKQYTNERSFYLQKVRNQIESSWQKWELAQLDVVALQKLDVSSALTERAAFDLNPPLSEDSRYLRQEMSEAGYQHLLAIASFDGLIEASRLSRILGGAANEVQCTLTRVLIEEYGNGRLSRKHSTFFAQMLSLIHI